MREAEVTGIELTTEQKAKCWDMLEKMNAAFLEKSSTLVDPDKRKVMAIFVGTAAKQMAVIKTMVIVGLAVDKFDI